MVLPPLQIENFIAGIIVGIFAGLMLIMLFRLVFKGKKKYDLIKMRTLLEEANDCSKKSMTNTQDIINIIKELENA